MADPRPHGDAAGPLVLEGRSVEDGRAVRVTVDGGVIAALEPVGADAADATVAPADWLSPGWLDVQVNGFAGHDPNAANADPSNTIDMVRALWRRGVTGVCPTICTESEEHIIGALRAIAAACEADPLVASAIVGIHVEGPHISPEDGPRGAHPLRHIRPPDVTEYRRWQEAARGRIRIVTLSPEYAEAVHYVRAIVADGVVASVGHTSASGDQIRAVVDAGATWSTHLGNGAHATIRRHPNYIWDQLAEDRLAAGFIFDGHHLPPAVMRSVVRAKGVERTILVSDALYVAGLPPGDYALPDGAGVTLRDTGRLELTGTPYLAGAASPLPVSVGNAMRHAGLTLADAVRTVTANPSRLLGLGTLAGRESIRVGARANLTVFRQDPETLDISIRATVVDGVLVYSETALA
jgi:N-acetylglucosamine-6-phosphate deacetylase